MRKAVEFVVTQFKVTQEMQGIQNGKMRNAKFQISDLKYFLLLAFRPSHLRFPLRSLLC